MKTLSMTICAAICCMGNPAGIAGESSCRFSYCSSTDWGRVERDVQFRNMELRQQEMNRQMQQNQYRRQQGLREIY